VGKIKIDVPLLKVAHAPAIDARNLPTKVKNGEVSAKSIKVPGTTGIPSTSWATSSVLNTEGELRETAA